MGRTEGSFIGKHKDKRKCPECGELVWIKWDKSPNIKCPKCGYIDDVEECEGCGNLMSQHSDSVICLDCWRGHPMKK